MIARAAAEVVLWVTLVLHPAPKPAPAPPPRQPVRPASTVDGGVWDRIAACESGGNWQSTVGLFEGGLQFHPKTWDSSKPDGYPDAAYEATKAQQIHVAEIVLREQGSGAWPVCSRKVGLR